MPARDEPSIIEAIARALLLARQDVEAVLATEPAWQALGAIGPGSDGTGSRERDLVSARLALVPAYRSLQRINEALEGLAHFAATQTASRANNWAGAPAADAPSLQHLSAVLERGRAAAAMEMDATLSGWLPKEGADGDQSARPAVDLDRMIALIRKGTATRGPQPLKGLLASLAASAVEAMPPQAKPQLRPTPEAPVFPETISQAPHRSPAEPEAVDLVPIVDDAVDEAAEDEIVVDEAGQMAGKPVALEAPAGLSAETDPLDAFARINRMEAEVAGLSDQTTRKGGPAVPSAPLAGAFDPAGEATVEIVLKHETAHAATPRARPGFEDEAVIEIVSRPGNGRR